ncbi:TetR-like C-terminal domain-containing protein [Paracoccus sp. NSM]|uniref:TetR-like C-terminal domain-containing protein n=1 Tax=Paracoccus sp. NSM TaxID=3457784 RepID=UPI0040374E47
MTNSFPRQTASLHERAMAASLQLTDSLGQVPSLAQVVALIDVPKGSIDPAFSEGRDLLIAAIERSLTILIDDCTRAVVKVDPEDPVAQFTAIGEAYLEWASRHPAQFRLLADTRRLDYRTVPRLRRYVDSLNELMSRLLLRARDQGRLHPREDIEMLVLSSRCFAMGAASMIVDGRLDATDGLGAAKRMMRDFVLRMARSSRP